MFGKILASAFATFLSAGSLEPTVISSQQAFAPQGMPMYEQVQELEQAIKRREEITSDAYQMRSNTLQGKVGETWKAETAFRPNNRSIDKQQKFRYDVRTREALSKKPVIRKSQTTSVTNPLEILAPTRSARKSVTALRGKNTTAIRLKPKASTVLQAQNSIYTSNIQALRPWDHVRGNPETTVSLIVYTDLECPFCASFHPTLIQALEMYKKDINWVYRPYPLAFHENAKTGAIAAECVHQMGGVSKFWSFVDTVYVKGADNDMYTKYASDLGLDAVSFNECVKNETSAGTIALEIKAAQEAGVTGTPYVSLVNRKTGKSSILQGAQPIGTVQKAIEEILK